MSKHGILKKDISAPLTESFKRVDVGRVDSGNILPDMNFTSNEPFFDASASQVGTPEHHMLMQRQASANKKLSSRHLQSYVQAVAAFRRQVQAMSAASEMFARACESLKETVPASSSTDAYKQDLDLLIDSTHLISNSHQIWAANLGVEVEDPLVGHLSAIATQAKRIESANAGKIAELTERLHKEEEKSYKLGKKKQRDLSTLQNSLTVRMGLADEIKRLGSESQTVQDQLSNSSVEFVLKHCHSAVSKELETYATVMEGLKKLGAFDQPIHQRRGSVQHPQDRSTVLG